MAGVGDECPKCGGGNVVDGPTYRNERHEGLSSGIVPQVGNKQRVIETERLEYRCNKCGYTISVACKDAPINNKLVTTKEN